MTEENNVKVSSITVQEYVDKVKEIGIKVAQFSDHVVMVGYGTGEIAPRQTIVGALRDVAFDDVIMFDIRPYNQPFEPKGYSPLPEYEKMPQLDWDNEMLDWEITADDLRAGTR